MIEKLLNLFRNSKPAAPPVVEPVAPAAIKTEDKPKRPRKPRKPKVTKAEAKVDVLKFDFDPNNPRIGSLELDWNTEFVELLVKHGYNGTSEEEIVDSWLNDVCRTIILNQFPGAVANSLAGSKVVNRRDVGDGKTEVS